MPYGFRKEQPGERLPRKRELRERAGVRVFAIEKFERKKRRQQRGDPHHARCHDNELRFLRRNGERKQRCDNREEDQRLHELAGPAECEPQIAAEHEPCGLQPMGLWMAGNDSRRRRCRGAAHDASTIR